MNIFSKTNRSIAAVAAKVMAEQPAKVEEYKPKPLDNSLIDKVVASGLQTRFDIAKKNNLKEEKLPWQKVNPHMPGYSGKVSDEIKTAPSGEKHEGYDAKETKPSSPERKPVKETQKESIDANLNVNGQINMKGVYVSGKKKAVSENEEPPFSGPYKKHTDTHKDEFGNVIKTKNVAKHLAKMGLKKVLAKRKGK